MPTIFAGMISTGLSLAAAMALVLPQSSQAQSLKDRVVHNQCTVKLTKEMASKGIANPPQPFINNVCDCVVINMNAGDTIEQSKQTCKAEVKAKMEGEMKPKTTTPQP